MTVRVRLTANFEANLDSIRDFLSTTGLSTGFDELTRRLFDEWIPNLTVFPHIGREFLRIEPQSIEAEARRRRLAASAGSGTEIREYIARDYLLLYALRGGDIYLLSIRHHGQLSFDLKGHWH
jgi:hypothetical protein